MTYKLTISKHALLYLKESYIYRLSILVQSFVFNQMQLNSAFIYLIVAKNYSLHQIYRKFLLKRCAKSK